MAILGGSPLGLIGLASRPTNGTSGFNGGKTRNVKVSDYNNSKAGTLFTGRRYLRAYPNINSTEGGYDTLGTNDVDYEGIKKGTSKDLFTRKALHSNSIYDTSILNIIEKLAPTKAALRPADFAYLKYVGVYPNNRLMIARRFATPTQDNIMVKKNSKNDIASLATMISWVKEGDDFLDISFGEEWEPAEADFKNILNSFGEDFNKKGLGDLAGGGGGLIPLPGFTEIFQRKFLSNLGVMDDNAAASIPAGNPNLIKEAKQRKTVGYEQAGAGLKCKISIKMECVYELKFIAGMDPTIVWMDILGNITRFGTSKSDTYGLSKSFSSKIEGWSNNPSRMIDDILTGLTKAIKGVVEELKKIVDSFQEAVTSAISNPAAALQAKKTATNILLDNIKKGASEVIRAQIMKYRIKVLGIVHALSGLPSTPWHITIGNPMRPVFCSGDMLVEDVNLKLGPTLAFNDLPSNITAEFTITNARSLGLQEIMAKFNSGYLRTVDVSKSIHEININIGDGKISNDAIGILDTESTIKAGVNITESPTPIPEPKRQQIGNSGKYFNSNDAKILEDDGKGTKKIQVKAEDGFTYTLLRDPESGTYSKVDSKSSSLNGKIINKDANSKKIAK